MLPATQDRERLFRPILGYQETSSPVSLQSVTVTLHTIPSQPDALGDFPSARSLTVR
jgi:hypothetical protein